MIHQYCLFYRNNKLQFGWIQEIKKNKLVVIPEKGKEFNCSVKQTELIWPGKEFPTSSDAMSYLSEKICWVIQRKEEFDIETIHELCEKNQPYTLDQLSADFLDDPANGWEKAALLFTLKENNRLFQRKKECFLARSEAEIEKKDIESQKKEETEKTSARELEWARSLTDSVAPEIVFEEMEIWNQFIQRIKLFLIHLDESREKDYFSKLFGFDSQFPRDVEFQLLICLKIAGSPLSWGQLQLQRASVKEDFSPAELESIEALKESNIWETPYKLETLDQRELIPVTIDAVTTRDYDDAISWQIKESGLVLRVHIADVSSFIGTENPLFSGASERISSLYTLKRTYHLLPSDLSENAFSLQAGAERAVMTLEIEIDQKFEPVGTKLYRSVIRVSKNLSYQEADQRIKEEDPEWLFLDGFGQQLKKIRMENGALDLDRQEVKLNISNPENIVIETVRENTPANMLVQELAIYTNSIVAKRCYDDEMPALFRNQPPYKVLTGLEEGEKPKLQNLQIKPATIGITPTGHSALGLDTYLQCTSPIRRFSDLVCQGILFSSISGMENPHPDESLLLWAKQCELTQKLYNKVERDLSDYWKYKYLSQNPGAEYECEVSRKFRNGNYQLLITDLQLQIEVNHPDLVLNSTIKIVTNKVNPITRKVELDFVQS